MFSLSFNLRIGRVCSLPACGNFLHWITGRTLITYSPIFLLRLKEGSYSLPVSTRRVLGENSSLFGSTDSLTMVNGKIIIDTAKM